MGSIIVDFILLFKARFPSLLSTCQLRFQIRKLGGNFARKFASSFQSSNFDCKQMFTIKRWPRRDIIKYILHFRVSAFSTFAFPCFRIFIFSCFRIFNFCIPIFPHFQLLHFHISAFSYFRIFMFLYFHIFVFSYFRIFMFSYFVLL
jgi:hypothetical protein